MDSSHLAEFIATLFFVYIVLATGNAIAIGAALALAILLTTSFKYVTVNPAVSIALAAAGKMPVRDLLPRIIIQILAGLIAYELYKRFTI